MCDADASSWLGRFGGPGRGDGGGGAVVERGERRDVGGSPREEVGGPSLQEALGDVSLEVLAGAGGLAWGGVGVPADFRGVEAERVAEVGGERDECPELFDGDALFVEVAPEVHVEGAGKLVVGVALRAVVDVASFEDAAVGGDEVVVGQVGPVFVALSPGLQVADSGVGLVRGSPEDAGVMDGEHPGGVPGVLGEGLGFGAPLVACDDVRRLGWGGGWLRGHGQQGKTSDAQWDG